MFDYPVLDAILDSIMEDQNFNAQVAFDHVTNKCSIVRNDTKDYWGSQYIYNGVIFAFYIERKAKPEPPY